MPSPFAPPRRITNPVTGDRIEFLTSPLSGDAGPLVFRTTLAPGAGGSPLHAHRTIAETFSVEAGQLTFLDPRGEPMRLEAGSRIHVADHVRHGFRNDTAHAVTFVTEATPGEGFERFLRVMYGLAEDGRTDAGGMPRDPRALALALEQAELLLPGLPEGLQVAVIGGLARLARISGLGSQLERYFHPVAAPTAAFAGA